MKTFLEAIATMEGFYKNGSRPQRLNNPGDIEAGLSPSPTELWAMPIADLLSSLMWLRASLP